MKKRVAWINNIMEFPDEVVVEELKNQGDYENYDMFKANLSNLYYVKELWCFGNCATFEIYKKAQDLGLDIWQMM